jgi:hypothetical protein
LQVGDDGKGSNPGDLPGPGSTLVGLPEEGASWVKPDRSSKKTTTTLAIVKKTTMPIVRFCI